MSKYTTEVRNICETYAGFNERAEYPDVETVLENSYRKIFDVDNINVYVPDHKPLLLKKILLHYYQREIAFETAGLWKLKLNTKLKEILPYYNQLYESELLQYDPLKNVHNIHTHSGLYEDTSKVDNVKKYDNETDTSKTQLDEGTKKYDNVTDIDKSEIGENTQKYDNTTNKSDSAIGSRNLGATEGSTDTLESTYSRDEDVILRHSKTTDHGNDTITNKGLTAKDQWTLFSDTPQGGINGVSTAGGTGVDGGSLDGDAYLTNATHITDKAGEDQTTHVYGDITESYNKSGDKKDHTEINGEQTDTDTFSKTLTEGENTSNTAQGVKTDDALTHTNDSKAANSEQVDDALTKTTDSMVANGTQVDDATTVEDNLRRDNGSDSYENREMGKIGVMTYQEMVLKYRQTFLNIDMMIIDELGDLFMKVW